MVDIRTLTRAPMRQSPARNPSRAYPSSEYSPLRGEEAPGGQRSSRGGARVIDVVEGIKTRLPWLQEMPARLAPLSQHPNY